MKKLTVIISFIFCSQLSFGNDFDCGSRGLYFFPQKKEISLNSMFIIEGYGLSQKTINSLPKRKVYLQSDTNEIIDLVLLKTFVGQMELTQAIFKPKKTLKPNTTYFLKVSNLSEIEKTDFNKWNYKTRKTEPIYWKTSNKLNTDLLNQDLQIKFKETDVQIYGCGPAAYAVFDVKNDKEKEIWYKTEVIDLETNTKKTYIIQKQNNQLNVGHGMCAGAFTFNNKGKYKVRFTPMNTDGKISKTTKWLTFNNPFNNKTAFGK